MNLIPFSPDEKTELIKLIFDGPMKIAPKGKPFITKSGRRSPYFLNFGAFSSARKLSKLGELYAVAIQKIFSEKMTPTQYTDDSPRLIIYGPAYKGIPLALSTLIALQKTPETQTNYRFFRGAHYLFNRKEMKKYGDWGSFVGRIPSKNDITVIIDDVLTSGMSLVDAHSILKQSCGANVRHAILTVDRCERGAGRSSGRDPSAADYVNRQTGMDMYAMIDIHELHTMAVSEKILSLEDANSISAYIATHCVS